MATANFTFTTLTGTETAGWNSINSLITNIDTQLNTSNRLIYMSGWSAVAGQTIKWDAANSRWVPGTLDAAAFANNSVELGTKTTGDYVASITAAGTNEVSVTGTGEGAAATVRLANNTALRGAATVETPPTYSGGSTGTVGRVPDAKYVTDALAYATSGNVTLGGDVTGNASANTIANGAVTSAKILDGTIVNADINASAAIAYSKLNLTNSIVSGDIVDGTIAVGDLAAAVAERLVPVGTIQIYAGTTAPTGWLLCNGDTVPNGSGTVQSVTANYAALYAVLSTTYGSAGKLPDMQGRMPIGRSGTYTIGSTGGAATAALVVNNLPAHTHSVSETSTGGTAYASIVNNTNFAAGSGIGQRAIVNTSQAGGLGGYEGLSSFGTSPNHTHSVSVSGGGNGTGTGNAFNTISPYVAVNYIIKY